MARMLKFSALAALSMLALAIFVPVASARPVVFRGYVGPAWYGPGFYGWYGPAYYGPYPYVVAPAPDTGKVKIETKMKDAAVYVDGGYAGTVAQLKSFPLRQGTHDIELRDHQGQTIFQEHVDVLAGKTVKLNA